MSAGFRSETPERPLIQQKQHKRQCHKRRFAHQTERKEKDRRDVPAPTLPGVSLISADIMCIGPKDKHKEDATKDIFPFGYPRHGFHTKRVNGKYGRYERTGPTRSGQLLQRQKQEDRRCTMQQHVRQMMSARLEAVQLAIQHVRNRGEGVPVSSMRVGESPLDSRERETGDYYGIIVNIVAVVVIYEPVPERLTEDDPHNRCKNNGDNAGDQAVVLSARSETRNCASPLSLCALRRMPHARQRIH
jgi:hypothetical protein